MTRRHIHYEAAFEDYLRSQGMPYVAVDEAKKAIFAGERIKSFDFLVYGKREHAFLVDVKGRKFPYQLERSKRYWENWVAREDIDDLKRWEGVFGSDFTATFVFAYWLTESNGRAPDAPPHPYRGEYYAFLGIPVEAYAQYARPRSEKWGTVSLPTKEFRRLAQPFGLSIGSSV